MAAVKSPLTSKTLEEKSRATLHSLLSLFRCLATDLRPILRTMRSSTPLDTYSTVQSILPDIPRAMSSVKPRPKKRVRFALTLESIREDGIVAVPMSVEIKTKKRTVDPWRDEGPLYDAYLEYLQNKETAPIETLSMNPPVRPRPPSPLAHLDSSSPTYTTTYVLSNQKPPDPLADSISYPLPPMHLPRILERTPSSKKKPVQTHSPIRQRLQFEHLPHPLSPKKSNASSPVNRTPPCSNYPTAKRDELTPPLRMSAMSNEKSMRTDRSIHIRTVPDFLQPKKLTDVMNNPLPRFTKTSASRNPDELFFFHNSRTDHVQPIIH